MKDLKISVNKETRYVNLSKSIIGVDGENLQEKIVFSFEDEFVDGTARLEFENTDGKQYVLLEKENEIYSVPVKNVITKEGNIKMQLVITEGTDEENIPVFKSNQFYLWCEKSINAVKEAPDSYELWIETANEKLNEVDNLNIDLVEEDKKTKITITRKDGTVKETTIAGGDKGVSSYPQLEDLPTINGVELIGDKTAEELGITVELPESIAEIHEITSIGNITLYLDELKPGIYYMKMPPFSITFKPTRESEKQIVINDIVDTRLYVFNTYNEDLPDETYLISGMSFKNKSVNSFTIKKTYYGISDAWASGPKYDLIDKKQEITGLKTYQILPQSSVTPTDDKDFTNKAYVDGIINIIQEFDLEGEYTEKDVYGVYGIHNLMEVFANEITQIQEEVRENNDRLTALETVASELEEI